MDLQKFADELNNGFGDLVWTSMCYRKKDSSDAITFDRNDYEEILILKIGDKYNNFNESGHLVSSSGTYVGRLPLPSSAREIMCD